MRTAQKSYLCLYHLLFAYYTTLAKGFTTGGTGSVATTFQNAFASVAVDCNTRPWSSKLEMSDCIGGADITSSALPDQPGGDNSDDSFSAAAESSAKSDATFDWLGEWYPVIPVQDLSTTTPNKITLLGKDFVVWFHEPSTSWRAFADVCPHRLVPLSEGRLEGDVIQCAYHGWSFNEEGACTRIPQLVADKQALDSPRSCATKFPTRVEQGLLWLFPTADENLASKKSPALIAELDDPTMVDGTNFFFRDMEYSWDILVENLCDPAHVPFAHHSYMRGADRTKESSLPIDIEVTKETVAGFQAQRVSTPTTTGKYDVSFQAPCLLYYSISNSVALGEGRPKGENYIGLGQYCVPTAPGRCRLIARFPLKIPVPAAMWITRHTPRWITHFSQNIVMDSDVVFLKSQDEYLDSPAVKERNKPEYYLPAKSDSMVTAFRKWLLKSGGKPKWFGETATRSLGEPYGFVRPTNVPAKQGRDVLLDRFRQHTEVCSSCRRAHRTLYRMKEGLHAAGVVTVALAAALRASRTLRLASALLSICLLSAPRLVLQPIISRMEGMPWPRRKWLEGLK